VYYGLLDLLVGHDQSFKTSFSLPFVLDRIGRLEANLLRHMVYGSQVHCRGDRTL
jgi:hypothetical protein